jgi:iduronate 2-sulfatase/deleted-in-malignant-brain-tumors protein 1
MDKRDPFHEFNITHAMGDDKRAWSYFDYGIEANVTQEQYGTIPGPGDPIFNGTKGLSFLESPLSDDEQTDGMLAAYAIDRFKNFSRDGIGKKGSNKPFFHAVGFHKPHSPYIVPKKYFDMYDLAKVSLPPNSGVPAGFQEHNWYNDGNVELFGAARPGYTDSTAAAAQDKLSFHHPMGDEFTRMTRRAYFAAVSFVDAQIGQVLGALEEYGYKDNTIVTLWSDHGYHLGDTNSWCKCTMFESATRNVMLWRVPGQPDSSKGQNTRLVEMLDWFPTLLELTDTPPMPKCEGLDQPPTVMCLQGESYADEFKAPATKLSGEGDKAVAVAKQRKTKYAFSQWVYPTTKVPPEMQPYTNVTMPTNFRQGYTVRTQDGFRYTEYVDYDKRECVGHWTDTAIDPELYDYNVDQWETTNFAGNATYSAKVTELMAVLRSQFSSQ